jgi:hypothetical protein
MSQAKIKLERKTVYVYQYNGYHGTYAASRRLLWKCILKGANGQLRDGGDWGSEGIGNPDKFYALRNAKDWSKFTGWPVKDLGRAPQFDDKPKD